MIESVRNILATVESVKDRVFLSPMTEADLVSLEREVGLAIPSCLREYLRLVGLRQDLTRFERSDDEVFEQVFGHAEDFRDTRDFLKNTSATRPVRFFLSLTMAPAITWPSRKAKTAAPYSLVDHETEKIEELGTFCDWLAKLVEPALGVIFGSFEPELPAGEGERCHSGIRDPFVSPRSRGVSGRVVATLREWVAGLQRRT